jgi:geranylgeranyl pyrophosphate synthase
MNSAAPDFSLSAHLEVERGHAGAALDRILSELLPTLPTPSIRESIVQGIRAGGKRLRPILFVTAFRVVQESRVRRSLEEKPSGASQVPQGTDLGEGEPFSHAQLHEMAAALELIHGYSLIHDDLPCMDDAPLRRGLPTPHTLFGEGPATLAGAALIPLAGVVLSRSLRRAGLAPEVVVDLLQVLCAAAGGGGMVGGQALDLLGEHRALERAELDDLHRRKTGALLTAAVWMGGRAAGAQPEELEALSEYGRRIGLAFQISDDLLDATSTLEALGKAPSDEELGKSTYVTLLGVEASRREAQMEVDRAIAALRAAGIEAPPLEALARYIIERDS